MKAYVVSQHKVTTKNNKRQKCLLLFLNKISHVDFNQLTQLISACLLRIIMKRHYNVIRSYLISSQKDLCKQGA